MAFSPFAKSFFQIISASLAGCIFHPPVGNYSQHGVFNY
jgi:hypothetical protein